MCELFAMSSREAANASFSLEEFSKHGGLTDHHKDGWGVVYYRDNDTQIIREPKPAFNSAQLQFVKNHKVESNKVISHIRKATLGEVALRNTQPFSRELMGQMHTFVHNGMCPDIINEASLSASPYHPLGSTDSEYAFCVFMNSMANLYKEKNGIPKLNDKMILVSEFANHIRPMGPANFIYSDSEHIFCHGDRRKHPDGMRPPGLNFISRSCKTNPKSVHTAGLSIVTEATSQDIVLVASVPLTNEDWQTFKHGEILVLKEGKIVKRHLSLVGDNS
ncbi:MAG: putative glutamine amidotransferase [Candidatus Azotimanducaceae bacterium]|jgi:predicted glutamine amidotransferase